MSFRVARRAAVRADFVVDRHGRVRAMRQRPGRAAMLVVGTAAALVAAPLQPWRGEALIATVRAAVRSAADLIRARSPGLRARADLVKTKAAPKPVPRIARAAPRLHRAAAAPVLLAPPPPRTPLAFDAAPLTSPFVAPTTGPVPEFASVNEGSCCLPTINPPMTTVGGSVFGPGGTGTVPGGGNPPPGIPEPSNWATMILGFALLGAIWRRRRLIVERLREIPLRLFYTPVRRLVHAVAK